MNVKENLKAYLDGELNEQERAQVEQALAQDPSLQQEMDQLTGLSSMLKSMAKPVPIKGYEATRERIASAAKPSLAFVWKTLGAVAIVSILATMFFPVFAQSKEAAKRTQDMMAAKAADVSSTPASGSTSSVTDDLSFEEKGEYTPGAGAGVDLKRKDYESFAGGADVRAKSRAPMEESRNGPLYGNNSESSKKSISEKSANPAPQVNTYNPGLTLNNGHDIVRNADLSVKVADIKSADLQVKAVAARSGGYLESSSVYAPEGEDVVRTASYSIRVDSHQFDRAVGQLSALGEVLSVSTSGDDITAQIVDTDARLKAMHSEEDQYLTVLKSAKKIGEILEVKDRLANVRQRIESLEAQKKNFKSLAQLSTITLSLTEDGGPVDKKPAEDDWVGNSVKNAGDILGAVGKFLAQTLIYVAILSPIWVPVLLIGFWSYRKTKS